MRVFEPAGQPFTESIIPSVFYKRRMVEIRIEGLLFAVALILKGRAGHM